MKVRRGGIPTTREKVLSLVAFGAPDACWLWLGGSDLTPTEKGDGYGRIRWHGKSVRAHRLVFELLGGSPAPSGLVSDHLCRNTLCCNPAHIEHVSNATNVMRGNSFAAINARATHCIHGHEFTRQNTLILMRANGKSFRACKECRRAVGKRQRQKKLLARQVARGITL